MTEEERLHARVLGGVLAKMHGLEGGALARIEGRHRTVGATRCAPRCWARTTGCART